MPFLTERDVAPNQGIGYVESIRKRMKEIGAGEIADGFSGRFLRNG